MPYLPLSQQRESSPGVPSPQPHPVSAAGPYSTCAEAKVDGRCDIPRGDPDYWLYGDPDRDGMACEC